MIWATIVSLAVDVALTVAVAIVAVEAAHANSKASQLHTAQVTACQSANQFRAQQDQLWDQLITFTGKNPPPAGVSPAQRRAQLRYIRGYIHAIFRPRDCQRLYRLP